MSDILPLDSPFLLSKEIKTNLRNMALAGAPYEVCGVIHHHNIIHQYPNTFCGDKLHGFDMEVDLNHADIKAVWHSHPIGPDHLSDHDIRCMELLASEGFCFPWVVVTPGSITAWALQGILSKPA